MEINGILKKLGIENVNFGGFCGKWMGSGENLDSISPIDGKKIASVRQIKIGRAHV